MIIVTLLIPKQILNKLRMYSLLSIVVICLVYVFPLHLHPYLPSAPPRSALLLAPDRRFPALLLVHLQAALHVLPIQTLHVTVPSEILLINILTLLIDGMDIVLGAREIQ